MKLFKLTCVASMVLIGSVALLAQAERDPASLHQFASSLVRPGTATA